MDGVKFSGSLCRTTGKVEASRTTLMAGVHRLYEACRSEPSKELIYEASHCSRCRAEFATHPRESPGASNASWCRTTGPSPRRPSWLDDNRDAEKED